MPIYVDLVQIMEILNHITAVLTGTQTMVKWLWTCVQNSISKGKSKEHKYKGYKY